jgi:hypothetical protein
MRDIAVLADLDEVLASTATPLLLFKHSTI